MSCVFPINAWRSQKCNDTGKRPIVFNIRDGFADMSLQVPCGRCVGCTADKAKVWGIRCHHEASLYEQNSFITLTYSDPPPVSINKRDLQLFFKRLRRDCGLRYFACGEYGSKTHRPHYHAIIFGQDFLAGSFPINDQLYNNPFVQGAWGKGLVSIGSVTMESCMYVAGYCNKKIADRDTFNLMSRRPGIGRGWLDRYRDDLVRSGKVVIEGREYAIPKKYVEWYEMDFAQVAAERKRFFSSESAADRFERMQSLPARESNVKGRLALKSEVF